MMRRKFSRNKLIAENAPRNDFTRYSGSQFHIIISLVFVIQVSSENCLPVENLMIRISLFGYFQRQNQMLKWSKTAIINVFTLYSHFFFRICSRSFFNRSLHSQFLSLDFSKHNSCVFLLRFLPIHFFFSLVRSFCGRRDWPKAME